MTSIAARDALAATRIRRWLYIVALLVCAMVLLGGATRLTDSGLSITEWRPVTGTLLPMSEDAWLDEFVRYQGIPEYQIVNQGMSIDEFKTIYMWEWVHRNFGRMIGFVFFVPLLWFVATGQARGRLAARLFFILGLGALQAFAGWYMVQSGLTEGVDVSQYRLAIHLGIAFAILAAVVWTAFDLTPRDDDEAPSSGDGRTGAAVLLGLISLQILAGALVAGLDAGFSYNTWPLMDGSLVPSGLMAMTPWYLNFFENVGTVQFDHRMLAYVVFAFAVLHGLMAPAGLARQRARMIAFLVTLQVALGIITLVSVVPITLGLAHQALAMVVFVVAIHHLHSALRA